MHTVFDFFGIQSNPIIVLNIEFACDNEILYFCEIVKTENLFKFMFSQHQTDKTLSFIFLNVQIQS